MRETFVRILENKDFVKYHVTCVRYTATKSARFAQVALICITIRIHDNKYGLVTEYAVLTD